LHVGPGWGEFSCLTINKEVVVDQKNELSTPSTTKNLIENIPTAIKAILAGVIVYAIGSFPALAIVSIVPFPYSISVTGGQIWPESSSTEPLLRRALIPTSSSGSWFSRWCFS